jgi:hypothetical protein
MNSDNISVILILEGILPFLVLSIVLIMAIMAGRKKFKQASKSLILHVKANEGKEKQAILTFLTAKLSIDEKTAKKKVKKIMNERKFLIRNLVSGILDKNVEAISRLNLDLCRVSDHYHQLDVQAAPQEGEQGLSKEIEEMLATLKSEIKSLKQEVHITLTTLNNIFKEFSSMFGVDDIPEGVMSVDQIITAMESFSGKDSNDTFDGLDALSEDAELDSEGPFNMADDNDQAQAIDLSQEIEETDSSELLDDQLATSLAEETETDIDISTKVRFPP